MVCSATALRLAAFVLAWASASYLSRGISSRVLGARMGVCSISLSRVVVCLAAMAHRVECSRERLRDGVVTVRGISPARPRLIVLCLGCSLESWVLSCVLGAHLCVGW